MKNQSISLIITEIEGNAARIDLDGDFSPSFFTKSLTAFLKINPDFIPIFLDATGAALLGDKTPNFIEC